MAEYAHQECCMEAGSTFRIRLTDKCKRIFWSRPANFSHVRQSIFRSSMTYEANCRSQTPNLECKEHNKKNNDFSFFSKANTHQKYYFAYGKTMVRMKCTADKWVKTSSENCGFSTLKHVAVKKKKSQFTVYNLTSDHVRMHHYTWCESNNWFVYSRTNVLHQTVPLHSIDAAHFC